MDSFLETADLQEALREDVVTGLSSVPKTLPPKWFYDERGSGLFEQITLLEE
ncbi:MAG: L-histidine N(alpha)-methyltransferase, partial [Streptosporangiaceae bacterium]